MSGRDFRGMKNGVKDSGPGPITPVAKKKGKAKKKGRAKQKTPPAPSAIKRAMADPGDHEFR